ncbi:MAG TPA: hypothetical protein VFB45_06510 [Pseudolabrys sp.]|nr:hypothetical protein [Pseudolabrys sp.]
MDLGAFKLTLAKAQPPRHAAAPLAAMWWAAKGDWDRAHKLVMEADGADAAWVHAYLHRVEGDLGNAQYWYRAARRTEVSGPLDAEWDAIAGELLSRG